MIKIAIFGYGKLGQGVEKALSHASGFELVGVFTRREPNTVKTQTGAPTYEINELFSMGEKELDVVILCVGSPDLPQLAPKVVKRFCTVDGFDIHAKIPSYCKEMDESAKGHEKTALVAGGWDPGLFSIERAVLESMMPSGNTYTLWGKGVSEGHTHAVKGVDGVLDGVQYTLPKQSVIERIQKGESPSLSAFEMHERVCYVVAKDGADKKKIERDIKNMPDYFQGYTTSVNFVTEEQLKREYIRFSHGGKVLRRGKLGHFAEFSLSLASNPDFTGEALLSCARAAYALYKKGEYGAKTVLDIPPVYFSNRKRDELINTLL